MAVLTDQLQALTLQRDELFEHQRRLFAQRRRLLKKQRFLFSLQSQFLAAHQQHEVEEKYRQLEQWQQFFDEQDKQVVIELDELKKQRSELRQKIKQQEKSQPQVPPASKSSAKKKGVFGYLFSETGLMLWVLATIGVLGLNFGGAIPLAGVGIGAFAFAFFIAGVAALAFFSQDSFALFCNMKQWGKRLDNLKWKKFLKNNAPAIAFAAVTGSIALAATLFVIFPPGALAAFFATAPVIGGMSVLALGSTVFAGISGIGFCFYYSGKNILQKFVLKKKKQKLSQQGAWEKRLVTFAGAPTTTIGTVAAALTFFSIALPFTGGAGILPAICAAVVGGGAALSWLSMDGNSLRTRLKEMGQWLDKTDLKPWIWDHKWSIVGVAGTAAAMVIVGAIVIFPPAAIVPVIAATGLPSYVAAAVAACAVYIASRVVAGGIKGMHHMVSHLFKKRIKKPQNPQQPQKENIAEKRPQIPDLRAKKASQPLPDNLDLRSAVESDSDDSSDYSDDSINAEMSDMIGNIFAEPMVPDGNSSASLPRSATLQSPKQPQVISAQLLAKSLNRGPLKPCGQEALREDTLKEAQSLLDELDNPEWLQHLRYEGGVKSDIMFSHQPRYGMVS